MSSSMNIPEWLIFIQGKLVSQDILEYVRREIGDVSVFLTHASKKQLLDKIVSLTKDRNINVDCKYIYENILGFHIEPLDLQTENLILNEFETIKSLIGENDMKKVPLIYILQKISTKNNLNITPKHVYPSEKVKIYDSTLASYILSV